LITNQLYSQNNTTSVSIPASQLIIDGNNYNINPGDTIRLSSGIKEYLRISNFHGDSLHYIVFINDSGSVIIQNNSHPFGILIVNSSYFKFTGTGVDTIKYGFKILKTQANMNGLNISGKTTNYEIDHFEIANTGFAGIMAKTDPVCDLSTNYGYFTQYQTSIHDNYLHDIGGEGFYIGHSYFGGYQTNCNGQADTLYPHELKGVRIFNNYLENCHWDGIQLGCATEDCEIYGNIVTNYGLDSINGQNSGIQISGGTTGKCYNNLISNGSGNGINVFGLGNNLIFNNIILNAGKNYFVNNPTQIVNGIFCDDRTTISGLPFMFMNNTIINPKTDGIRFYSTQSNNNKFFNNIIIHPGSLGNYSNINQSYIFLSNGVNASLSNNYFAPDMININFKDSLSANFKLTAISPALDAGIDVSPYGINFDFDNIPRPSSFGYDIGAYEYVPEIFIQESNNMDEIHIFPNPNEGIFTISFPYMNLSGNFKLKIINPLGKIITEHDFNSKAIQTINISKLAVSGLYTILIQSEKHLIYKKIIINKPN
jgi:hypothetical protein